MISVILCSADADAGRLRRAEAHYEELLAGHAFEVIGMHGVTSFAEGANRGVDRSTGDVLVFSHDDVEVFAADVTSVLGAHLASVDIVGVMGASRVGPGPWHAAGPPYVFGQVAHALKGGAGYRVVNLVAPAPRIDDIQVMPGFFLACRRSVVERQRFDAATFDGAHGYDLDFTFRAYLAGLKLGVATDIAVVRGVETFDDAGLMDKHAARFTAPPILHYELASVDVATKKEALECLVGTGRRIPTS